MGEKERVQMIKGVGTDIVQISRLTEKIAHKVLSAKELEAYNGFNAESRKREYLAGRFAAKEALLKALPKEYRNINLTEIVIINDSEGKPRLESPSFPKMSVVLSIAHERDVAIAFCVLETILE